MNSRRLIDPSLPKGRSRLAHPEAERALLAQLPVLDAFDVARARGLQQHQGSGTAHTARLPLEGLSAFGGDRKDCKMTTGRYPPTRLPIDVNFWPAVWGVAALFDLQSSRPCRTHRACLRDKAIFPARDR